MSSPISIYISIQGSTAICPITALIVFLKIFCLYSFSSIIFSIVFVWQIFFHNLHVFLNNCTWLTSLFISIHLFLVFTLIIILLCMSVCSYILGLYIFSF